MSVVDRQVGIARSRLNLNVFMHWLSIGVLVAAGIWALIVLVERLFPMGIPLWYAGAGAGGVALVIAIVGSVRSRVSSLSAAVAVDKAAGLKERLSTAILIGAQADPWARAAVTDAEKSAAKIHVPSHVAVRAPEMLPWSVACLASALLLMFFMPTVNLLAGQDKKKDKSLSGKEVAAENRELKMAVEEQIKSTAKEMGEENAALKDLAEELSKIELPDKPTTTPDDIRREAVKKIEDVTKKLEEKAKDEKFDVLEQTKQMMSKLDIQKGDDAASKLGEALQKGDTKGAKDALEEMKKTLDEATKNADPETQKRVAEMEQKLEKLADQMSKMSDTQQITKDLQNKAGMSEDEAKKLMEQAAKADPKELQKMLQQQLADKGMTQQQIQELAQKMSQNQQAQQAMKQMSQSLMQAAQAMQQCQSPGSGNSQQASQNGANAMSDAAEQLSQMEMNEQLMNDLQSQISQLEKMKSGVCQNPGDGQGQGQKGGDKPGPQGGNVGIGIGEKFGKEKAQHAFSPEKANVRMQGGTIIGKMLVDGPQLRGEATAEVRDAVNAGQRDAQDAIDRRSIPRQYERVTREYFDRLAGLAERKKAAEAQKSSGAKAEEGEAEKK